MREHLGPALRLTLLTLVLTGLLYPLAVTGLSRLLFAERAQGSLVHDGRGKVVGSELIAQPFSSPGYFHPRPSAAGENGYDAASSGGSNLGPTSKKLAERVAGERERLRKENPEARGPVPAELLTTSGSGLDPHLSPEAALWQAPRVARARGVDLSRVETVVRAHLEGRDLGVFGEPRVNVLLLNLAIDRQFGQTSAMK